MCIGVPSVFRDAMVTVTVLLFLSVLIVGITGLAVAGPRVLAIIPLIHDGLFGPLGRHLWA